MAPSRANSARVDGIDSPYPEHSTFPVPQSPVAHEKLPVELVEQNVLPRNDLSMREAR